MKSVEDEREKVKGAGGLRWCMDWLNVMGCYLQECMVGWWLNGRFAMGKWVSAMVGNSEVGEFEGQVVMGKRENCLSRQVQVGEFEGQVVVVVEDHARGTPHLHVLFFEGDFASQGRRNELARGTSRRVLNAKFESRSMEDRRI